MKLRSALLALSFFLAGSKALAASTWYVRTDGGDPAHCTGLVNAPYSPTVTAKACAISHPMYLLPPNLDANDVGRKPLIAGGDTVNIAAGSYQFGLPFNGGSWGSCSVNWPYDCHMQPVPSGTAAAPTQILGAGSKLTQLWGSGGAGSVLNLTGSSNVIVSGLEITDHSNCIQNHVDPAVKCAAGGLWAANGITNTAGGTDNVPSSNVQLTDVLVDGMAKYGMLAGNISGWTLTNVRIIANGFGGWSLDTGPKSPSSGTNTMQGGEIGWNGCTYNYPSTAVWGCWGQQSGGYGDGLGSSSASDLGTWLFQDVSVHDNTQDGLDFLHANVGATITYNRVNAQRNAGNQLKVSGTATVTNSIVNGGCGLFAGVGSMQGNNSNSGNTSGDICRAQGDTIVVSQAPGLTTVVDHNTVISEGNTLVTVPSSGFGDKTSVLKITNNILIGTPRWIQNDGSLPAIWWWGDGTPVNTPSVAGNVLYSINYGTCPAGNTCTDPKLTNDTIAAFDPTPTAATPTGVGANAAPIIVVPPPPSCTGGIVSGGACYCPAGTTAANGACASIPKACVVVQSCTVAGAVSTCTATCQ